MPGLAGEPENEAERETKEGSEPATANSLASKLSRNPNSAHYYYTDSIWHEKYVLLAAFLVEVLWKVHWGKMGNERRGVLFFQSAIRAGDTSSGLCFNFFDKGPMANPEFAFAVY